MRPIEIFFYCVAGLCFLGGADAWFDVGATEWLVSLCLTDPDIVAPPIPSLFMDNQHKGHALLWFMAGSAMMLLALGHEKIAALIIPRSRPGIHRRRMIAALLHVAHAAGPVRRSVIDGAFFQATGERLGPNEARSAYKSCFRKGAPTLSQILKGVEHPSERRELVLGTSKVWFETGMDSEKATGKLEEIMSKLGLSRDEVATCLDPAPPSVSRRVLGEVRRVTSSMLTSRQI